MMEFVCLFSYITGGAPQAVPGTACVEANQTVCTEVCCSSDCSSSETFVCLFSYLYVLSVYMFFHI
jgi:hypothetical protein